MGASVLQFKQMWKDGVLVNISEQKEGKGGVGVEVTSGEQGDVIL